MRRHFVSLPLELEDAGRVDGVTIPQFFYHVAFPLAKPMIVTLAVLGFIASWGSLLPPLVFINDLIKATVPLGLYQFGSTYATNWPVLMAATTVSLVPSLILYLCPEIHHLCLFDGRNNQIAQPGVFSMAIILIDTDIGTDIDVMLLDYVGRRLLIMGPHSQNLHDTRLFNNLIHTNGVGY